MAETSIIDAVRNVHDAMRAAYEDAAADQAADVAYAIETKTGLPDGYWKPAHIARLRYLAALAVMEAVNEG
jgi:hypothetical protein